MTIVQGSPNLFMFLALAIFVGAGFGLSKVCMRCLMRVFGEVRDEGLSEDEIRNILKEERERRMKKNAYRSGVSKELSKEEEEEMEKRVAVYKAKIASLMEEGKKKKA